MFSKQIPLAVTAVWVLGGSAVHAELLNGRVVDDQGVGVSGVNLDAFDANSGDRVTLLDGGTDSNGFFSATIDPGIYRIVFVPPPPPVTSHLATERDGVVVVGTVDLGTIALPAGIAVAGRVVWAGSIPVGGVDIDVRDGSGNPVVTANDFTDPFGEFELAVPSGGAELRFDPTSLGPPLLAPTKVELSSTVDIDLGDVELQPGFVVSGTVTSSAGAVANADFDVVDATTGDKLYTPSDSSNSSGFVDFVVPAGTYDIEVCPRFADRLVAKVLAGVVVASNHGLGTIVLQNGVVLSGTIRDGAAMPVPGADVDLKLPGSSVEVLLCGDNANAQGQYAVVVPTGTFDVKFTAPYSAPYGTQRLVNVSIGGDTVRNGTLPDCPFASRSGPVVPGSGGLNPRLSSFGGSMRLGNPNWGVRLDNGRGGAAGVLSIGLSSACTNSAAGGAFRPLLSAGRRVSVAFVLSGPAGVPGAGSTSLPFALPSGAGFTDLAITADAVVFDPGASGGRAQPRTLCGNLCD